MDEIGRTVVVARIERTGDAAAAPDARTARAGVVAQYRAGVGVLALFATVPPGVAEEGIDDPAAFAAFVRRAGMSGLPYATRTTIPVRARATDTTG